MRLDKSTFLLVCALAVLTAPKRVIGQSRVIRGTVIDSAGTTVPYANVIAIGSGRRVVASADGRFQLPLDHSVERVIEVRRIGYHPTIIELDSWPDTALRVVIAVASRTLGGVTIAVQRLPALALHGFYERVTDVERGINHGFFITPEELDSRPGGRVTDFLQGHHGIPIKQVKAGSPWGDGRKGWQPQGTNGCRMEIFLDGVRFYGLTATGSEPDSFINDLVSLSSIAGIEVYPRSVTAPPKYQSLNGLYGVILIWTK